MFNYEDLLASLQNGKSAEDLASQFSEALNRASREVEEKKLEEAKRQEKEEELNNFQIFWTKRIIDLMQEYVDTIYPDLSDKFAAVYNDFSNEDCLNMCFQLDSIIQLTTLLGGLG